MQIDIHFNTDTATESDYKALLAVANGLAGQPASDKTVAEQPDKPAAKGAVKKATSTAKKATAKPEPTPEPDEPEEEPEEAEDDNLLGDEVPTRDDAVQIVSKMIDDGEAPKVKKVLTKFKAKRLSEVPDEDIPAFVEALS